MNAFDFLLTLAVAVVLGTLAQLTSRMALGGWFIHLGLAFAGALAGVYVARSFNVPEVYNVQFKGFVYPVTWAVIGSALFLGSLSFFIRTGRH
jgi:hypothetical protein